MAPIKIVQPQPPSPVEKADADFGELATLIGYDLIVPDDDLHLGENFEQS